MTITHSNEDSIVGWDIMKLIRHCDIKKYVFEKVMNVVCLDGHEDDPVEIIEDEEPGKQKAISKPLNKKRK